VVSLEDKELSIASSRTLHIIVPSIRDEDGISDLKFCLGVGESLGARGKLQRLLDINPWRQIGGVSHWEFIVAYTTLGRFAHNGLMRRHSIWHLRGDTDSPLWSEEEMAPPKKAEQVYLARVPAAAIQKLDSGIYVFRVEYWDPKSPKNVASASKTFEVLP
jgi:hypothetical protein